MAVVAAGAALFGCSKTDESFNKPGELTGTCVSCHEDQDLLIATVAPDTSGGGGESGEG